jgi:hypothetical protein
LWRSLVAKLNIVVNGARVIQLKCVGHEKRFLEGNLSVK